MQGLRKFIWLKNQIFFFMHLKKLWKRRHPIQLTSFLLCDIKNKLGGGGLNYMQFLTAFRIVTNLGFLGGVPHNILPVLVHDLEQPALLRHLLHDVLRGEDGLQIQPLGLHLQPLINGVLDPQQPLLPILTADNSKNTSQISLESFKEM